MPDPSATSRIRLTGARDRAPVTFDLRPDPEIRRALAAELGLDALKKLRFHGEMRPISRQDWELDAVLGATMVQPCGITLEPVVTRIDEPVRRRYLAEHDDGDAVPEREVPAEDDEPLPASLDLEAAMMEALSLAVPAFPRAEGAELGSVETADPGASPLDEAATKPFAGLADRLKDFKT